ncbi:RNA polymerase III-inhibiting protein maf1 [Boothiomyces sp. JEL0866]|nr:RNA polymerase III-inhibiting protein maf1 [Boothiomyces sp. JEL0866]
MDFDVILSPKSPYGPLSQTTSRKTLFYLLSTLNAVYPDYDFSDTKPELFTKIPTAGLVINQVKNLFFVHFGNSQPLADSIWESVDQVMNVKDCDIYAFTPGRDVEPDAEEGNLWSVLAPLQPEESNELMYDSVSEEEDLFSKSLSYEQYTMQQMDI